MCWHNERPKISLNVNIVDFDRLEERIKFLQTMEVHVSSCAECLRVVLMTDEVLEDAGCSVYKAAYQDYSIIRDSL